VSVVGLDSKNARLLFENGRYQGHSPSPDRRWFAVSEGSYGRDSLHTTRLGRFGLRRIATVNGLIQGARWSPDGRRIAFAADDLRAACRLTAWIVTVETRVLRKLSDCAGLADWASDSRRIAYVTHEDELRVADLAAGRTVVVARGVRGGHAGAPDNDDGPRWSPGGLRIAYIGGARGKLHVVRLADGKDIAIAPASAAAAWSPDGRRLAFVHDGRLAVIHRDGSNFRVLDRAAIQDLVPAWSPDGRWIAYARVFERPCRCGSEVFVVPVNGGRARRLTDVSAKRLDGPRHVELGSPSWSRDSRRIFYLHYIHFGE
jgi:Tol biopolymer transport system component